jgi:branched-subunit amino acid transport protein
MAEWEIWATICLVALSTVLCRGVFWLLGHRVAIPPRVQEMLRFAPACALAAVIVPDLVLGPDGQLAISPGNPKLVAGLAALLFFWLRRNMLQTIIFGMVVLTLLRVFHIFSAVG